MATLKRIYLNALALLDKLTWFPPLLARITIGAVFIEAGWGKINNLPKVIEFFESLHIPASHIQAPLVAGTEFLGGLLVLTGLMTRLASIPLIIIMVVAIATAKWADLETWTDLFGLPEYLYIVLLLGLLIAGAGRVSLDAFIVRAKNQALQRIGIKGLLFHK